MVFSALLSDKMAFHQDNSCFCLLRSTLLLPKISGKKWCS